ncbi:PREDICTED: interferon-induced guanylate-binding protein 1-like [Dipodomys ordii]|uniref:Interferon-induced guanylate-binding protein 1-like n=1 Tax=Dipodomys ordii TaxID=10020 RepID=A0A1S3FU27_DIPOR|nr:PREDICTED: interferon-induced guanylate-binding protein 1-like [Dipodomys ordii]
MDSEIQMPAPVCLIENVKGKLLANQEALDILSTIPQPVVVVAIVGLYRTGKSYLMNKLAGKKKGFSLGATVQSHTKGIWMWCVPHPIKPKHTLVLLDTEGLGDVEKVRTEDSTTCVKELQLERKCLQIPFFNLSIGNGYKEKNFNLPRLCIRKFFPKKKCFIFDRPAHRKKLGKLETLHDDELDSEFVKQVAEFCSYIFNNSKTKTISGGIKVNGPRLQNLVLTYINAISCGDLPCMENAVLALAQIENSAAVQKAIAYYVQQMNQRVQLPTNTLQELLDLHRACEKESIELFIKTSFKDIDQQFQKELAAQLERNRDEFCTKNIKASADCCSALIQEIFTPLEEEVKQGIYSKPGGYRFFTQKLQELKKKYQMEPGKGIQAEEILQQYLESKQDVADALLQTDQTLSEKEKEIEVERVKAEAAQASTKMLEEMQKKNQQMMEQKEKSYQEHVKQLTEKMEKERKELMAEQERTIALKLQEQARLLKEGFQSESRQLHNEIQNLQKRVSESRSKCVIC